MKHKPAVKIAIQVRGRWHKLSVIPQPYRGRVWVRYNDKLAEKMSDSTISLLMVELRKLIVKGLKNDA